MLMNRFFRLPCGLILLGLAACQPGNVPVPLHVEPNPLFPGKLPAAETLFAPFYSVYQASATHRLAAIRAYIQGNSKTDSSTLQFIYQGSQLVDKKFRPAGSATLIDLPRKLTFDTANRLVLSEATTSAASQTGTQGDARTEYTYDGDALKRAVRYTRSASGALMPAVDVTYTYLNGRFNSALIKSYVSQGSAGVSVVPLFTYQRTYSYSADGRSLFISDNGGAVIIDAQVDERGTILFEGQRGDISPEAYRPLFLSTGLQDVYRYANKFSSDRYVYLYDGPDGLISEVQIRSKGLVYQFIYQPK